MKYFLSDLNGASEEYFAMKKQINFKNSDELYIVGGILNGNSDNPKAGFDILDDIMANDNIHLVLGDDEYAHAMYYLAQESQDIRNFWYNYTVANDGLAAHKYLYESISEEQRDKYISYLISCEVSDFVKVGDRFVYLVHGSPQACANNDYTTWQNEIVTSEINLYKNYMLAIKSDPSLPLFEEKYGNIDLSKIIIVCGHVQTADIFDSDDDLMNACYKKDEIVKKQKLIFFNNKMLLNCGCFSNMKNETRNGWESDLVCVGMDAAGFFVEHLK